MESVTRYNAPNSPLISVVMSVFNSGAMLAETLNSILLQQGVDLELIVVNDGSTDDTSAILSEYSDKQSRIRVLNQENHGITNSLIRGCAEAKGVFIARQDAGDLSLPNRLARQLDALWRDRELLFVSCWTEFVGPKREPLYTNRSRGNSIKPTWILSETEESGVIDGPTCHGSVMFRRGSYNNIAGYRKEFVYGQDWDLWHRLGEAGKFQTVGEVLYQARIALDSISAGNREKQNQIGQLSRKALSLRLQGRDDGSCLKEVVEVCNECANLDTKQSNARQLYFIGECLRRNKDDRCSEYFRSAIKGEPMLWRAWVRLLQACIMD